MQQILFTVYHLAWRAALPLLRRSPRLRHGWTQRTLEQAPTGPFDLWIQSASGGESLLTQTVLAELATLLSGTTELRVLATSGTKQGVDSLRKGCAAIRQDTPIRTTVGYFPFDDPALMTRALQRFSPRLIVLLETELWPGLLRAARQHRLPVLLLNGRMSSGSHRRYRLLRWLLRPVRPTRILAISAADRARFAHILGPGAIDQMDNIKFDRINDQGQPGAKPHWATLLPPGNHFVLLGSIRREEEEKIITTIVGLLAARPDIVIGVFPKHIERADRWLAKLAARGITAGRRSRAMTPAAAGSVLVWDLFGELADAYGLAKVTFIGGSLMDLGGQNFLEPLVFGLRPFIGPYWSNFAWVSREIVTVGLVREVADEKHLLAELLAALDRDEPRALVRRQVQQFLAPRRGGSRLAAREIAAFLFPDENENR
ncbi:MAG: 3-deoxy-D-manno-octulosonic acid transferase [Desulfopila sp.]